MGVRISTGDIRSCLYDSVSGFSFGPTFHTHEEAESFCEYAAKNEERDLRKLTDGRLEELYSGWLRTRETEIEAQ